MIKYSPSIVVHNVVSFTDVTDPKVFTGICDDYTDTPIESLNTADVGDPEFKKLYLSLHSHKAERDSMSQILIFMRTDSTGLVLLKEISDSKTNFIKIFHLQDWC